LTFVLFYNLILSRALAKAGFKVAHIDTNDYYGGDQASLTMDEIVKWADLRANTLECSDSTYIRSQRAMFTSISYSQSLPPQPRQYSASLAPSIIPSTGPLISSLVSSGVSRYGSFKLLERIALYDRPGCVTNVPSTKEDIFKNKQLSLVEKRRLMRFFTFAAGEFEGKPELEGHEDTPLLDFLKTNFSIADKVAETITYALAFCTSSSGL
jgi:Rab proteins geranylgeranyltransferase component A